jgi:hypothetical protein
MSFPQTGKIPEMYPALALDMTYNWIFTWN